MEYGHEALKDTETAASPPKRPTNSRANWRMCVQDSMPQLRLYIIGETGRNYGKRQEDHRKEVESISNRTFTRSDRKSRAAEMNKSAITDHVAKENCVINWSGAKILEREGHR